MQEERARVFANVIMSVAAAGALYYVLKTPPLRRLMWQLSLAALTGTLPAWFSTEVRRAWEASNDTP